MYFKYFKTTSGKIIQTCQAPFQPSLPPMKIQAEHSHNFIITDKTTTAKHWNDSDYTIYNISVITWFSSTISDTSFSNVISTYDANETSTSEEIPLRLFSLQICYPNELY